MAKMTKRNTGTLKPKAPPRQAKAPEPEPRPMGGVDAEALERRWQEALPGAAVQVRLEPELDCATHVIQYGLCPQGKPEESGYAILLNPGRMKGREKEMLAGIEARLFG